MNWQTAPLNEVARIDRVQVDPRTIVAGTKYLGLEHIESGGRILSVQSVEPGELASSKFRFTPNHILYGKLRPYLAKISMPEFEGICSTDILPVLPGPNLDRKFLAYFLLQPEMVQFANTRSTGANLPRLSPKALASFEIPFPSLGEQRRIAAILDKADAIRRKREQALALADDLLKSTFLKMFFSPISSWPSVPLRSVARLINGDRSSRYPSGKDVVESGVLFLNTKNIDGSKLNFDNPAFITQAKFDSLTQGKLARYDLVVTLRGSIGQCAIFDSEFDTGFINAQLMIIRPSEKVLASYLHRLILHPIIQNRLLNQKSGSAVPQLTGKQIGDLEIPLPNLEAQKRFAEFAASTARLEVKLSKAIHESRSLFASLSQRAFRGEL